jgi:hypothetical protein
VLSWPTSAITTASGTPASLSSETAVWRKLRKENRRACGLSSQKRFFRAGTLYSAGVFETKRPVMIYRYLPSEFALLAIQQQRLKVGRLNELNDIFDCGPAIIPPKSVLPSEEEAFVKGIYKLEDIPE